MEESMYVDNKWMHIAYNFKCTWFSYFPIDPWDLLAIAVHQIFRSVHLVFSCFSLSFSVSISQNISSRIPRNNTVWRWKLFLLYILKMTDNEIAKTTSNSLTLVWRDLIFAFLNFFRWVGQIKVDPMNKSNFILNNLSLLLHSF